MIHQSSSSLGKYEQCPLLYKHHYIDGWREPQSENATFGVVLHDAVAHTLMDHAYRPDWYALYEENDAPQDGQELVQLTDEYYETWLRNQRFLEYPLEVEVEKEVYHPEWGLIVGKIDAIYPATKGDGLLIVDHKFMKSVTKHKDGLQMAVYSWLVPTATEFQYEKIGLGEYAVQKIRSLDTSLKKIDRIMQGIKHEEYGANPAQWYIPYCPYLKECGQCLTTIS